MEKNEATRCPACHLSQVYHRAKDNTYRCRSCGEIWQAKKHGRKTVKASSVVTSMAN